MTNRFALSIFLGLVALTTTAFRTPLASTGDLVWHDENKNGIQDAGEPGVPGVLVVLEVRLEPEPEADDEFNYLLYAKTKTDNAGGYSFPDLDPNLVYRLTFIAPPGYEFTIRDAAGDDSIDSDVDQITGRTDEFRPADGTTSGAGLVTTAPPTPDVTKQGSPPSLPKADDATLLIPSNISGNWELYTVAINRNVLTDTKPVSVTYTVSDTIVLTNTQVISGNLDVTPFHLHQVINDPAMDNRPVPSPDMDGVYFNSTRADSFDVYLYDIAANQTFRITGGPGGVYVYDTADDGKILAVSDVAGYSQIVELNPDGSLLETLTTEPGNHGCPRYSPDNSSILYTFNYSGTTKLHTMDRDGTNAEPVNADSFPEECGSYAPDGSAIVFPAKKDSFLDLYRYNFTSGETTRLTNDEAIELYPEWNSDGEWIAYISNANGTYDLKLAEVSPNNHYLITQWGSNIGAPRWFTPDASLGFQWQPLTEIPLNAIRSDVFPDPVNDAVICQQTTRADGGPADLKRTSVEYSAADGTLQLHIQGQNPFDPQGYFAAQIAVRGANNETGVYRWIVQNSQYQAGQYDATGAPIAGSTLGTYADDGTWTSANGIVIGPSDDLASVTFVIPEELLPEESNLFAVSAASQWQNQNVCDTAGPFYLPVVLK